MYLKKKARKFCAQQAQPTTPPKGNLRPLLLFSYEEDQTEVIGIQPREEYRVAPFSNCTLTRRPWCFCLPADFIPRRMQASSSFRSLFHPCTNFIAAQHVLFAIWSN